MARLAAGVGYHWRRLNELQEPEKHTAGPSGVAILQAIASINQTTRERFGTARAIIEEYLAEEPDNVDLQVALPGLHLRGAQMN